MNCYIWLLYFIFVRNVAYGTTTLTSITIRIFNSNKLKTRIFVRLTLLAAILSAPQSTTVVACQSIYASSSRLTTVTSHNSHVLLTNVIMPRQHHQPQRRHSLLTRVDKSRGPQGPRGAQVLLVKICVSKWGNAMTLSVPTFNPIQNLAGHLSINLSVRILCIDIC